MIWLKRGDFVLREGLLTPLGSFSGVSGEIFSMPRTNDNCFPDSWCLFEVKRFCQSPSQPYKCKEIFKIYLTSQKKFYWHTSSECFIFLDVVGEATELSLEVVVENSSVEKLIDSTWYPNCFIRHLKKQ